MTVSMAVVETTSTNIGSSRTRGRRCAGLLACLACLPAVLAVLVPAVASAAAAATHTDPALGISIPASARVKGTTSTSTTPASTTPATTTPATTKPATTTPAGAQPGTVAPTSTAPASATPPAGTTTSSTPTATTPTTTTHSGTVVVVSHKPSPKNTRLSAWALALAILGALLALGAIVWALARRLALEPRWTVSLMYSLREASSRASVTWAEFADWVRLGH